MLLIHAEGHAGMDLRADLLPAMLSLAQRTLCQVEVKANDTTFWAYPTDTVDRLRGAYDRLYPDSRIVATSIPNAVPRKVA